MTTADTGATNKRGATRARMVRTAAQVLRERGAAGVTIDEVLTRSGAPRGSVYHHFPDGRSQLLLEALLYAGDSITTLIDKAASHGGIALVHGFVAFWENALAESDFSAGCPVVAAAIGSADEAPALTPVAGEIFDRWQTAMARAFTNEGFTEADATSLAVMCISTLEGAVVLCRSSRSAAPLRDVAGQLEFLIKAKAFVKSNREAATGD